MESMGIIGLFVICILFIATCIYGIVAKTILIPERNIEIKYLQSRVDVFKNRSIELEEAVKNYKTALKFENLFFLVADPNAVMNFEHLETYLANHKSFYNVNHNIKEK